MRHMAGRKRHSAEDIVRKLRRADELAAEGETGEEIAAELEVSAATVYNWRRTYGGMDPDAAKELKELREQNARLKRLLAEAELVKDALREDRGPRRTHSPRPRRCPPSGAGDRHAVAQEFHIAARPARRVLRRTHSRRPRRCLGSRHRGRERADSLPRPASVDGRSTGGRLVATAHYPRGSRPAPWPLCCERICVRDVAQLPGWPGTQRDGLDRV